MWKTSRDFVWLRVWLNNGWMLWRAIEHGLMCVFMSSDQTWRPVLRRKH